MIAKNIKKRYNGRSDRMSFKIEINPELKMKSDIMFKAFYGRKENEEFLQDFLESVLGEKIKIKKVMHDVRLEQLAKEQKFGILDLGVELESGEFINIEIQLKDNKNIEKDEILKLVKSGIQYANMVVYEEAKKNPELEGMGTTLDVTLIYNNKIYIGHIGDSRVYRIRNKVMRKLTKDHSYVQQLLEDKKITREEAMHHPKKNMLTKALGCTSYIDPDLRARVINKNDIILMCSDGLTNMVSEEEIYQITKENPKEAANKLTMLANNHGGYDNITVLIIM